METTKPSPNPAAKQSRALFRSLPVLLIALVVGTSLLFMKCAVSDGAIEANIKELRAAADNLRQNPQDKQSLSLPIKQLSHRNRVYRSNAAAILGEAAPDVGAARPGLERPSAGHHGVRRERATVPGESGRQGGRPGRTERNDRHGW